MKTSAPSFLVLAWVFTVTNALGGTATPDAKCVYHCPPGESTINGQPPSADNTACDPAFVTYERAWASLKQAVATANKASQRGGMKLGASSEVEQALLKALDKANTPDRAWSVALEAWKSGVSAELQRQALAQVRSTAKTAADRETLNFMLSALENPAVEMDRCRGMGRGTAIERKTAADRLAVLLQNPNLADRLK